MRGAGPVTGALDAVLFDLDGTLVDSAPLWQASYVRLAAARGRTLPAGWWETIAGHTMLASTVVFDDGPAGAARVRPALVEPLIALAADEVAHRGVDPLPGALPLAREIVAAGLPLGVVTSAWRSFAQAVLHELELPTTVLVTGDEPLPGKPDPAPYRTACERLGVVPDRVVSIEDSPSGITSALMAGTRVLAVPSMDLAHTTWPAGHDAPTVVASLEGFTLAQLEALVG
jgi:HAD superfamily hydrolase (TIGR01509 family)